ncbi:MAG: hypothetical protein ACI90V_014356 [Bacillariaceae sp.]|jgi:hypothetical protein
MQYLTRKTVTKKGLRTEIKNTTNLLGDDIYVSSFLNFRSDRTVYNTQYQYQQQQQQE